MVDDVFSGERSGSQVRARRSRVGEKGRKAAGSDPQTDPMSRLEKVGNSIQRQGELIDLAGC